MDRTILFALAAAGIAGGTMWAWSALGATEPDPIAHVLAEPRFSREPISPIPPAPELPADKVALGKRLFGDKTLSADNTIACTSCHDLDHGGADGRKLPVGIKGRFGTVNTPTVWNADANVKQFWDGHADTLEEQIDGPVQNDNEMGSMWTFIIQRLRRDPSYVTAFGAQGISPTTVREAIATYERTLVSSGNRFDRWLEGDANAITAQEKDGYAAFKRFGCVSCHQGRNVGGNMFETLGVMGDYFADRGQPITKADLGRFNVTKLPEDRHRFRVPSLRLVSKTAPYFHDGQIATLEEAVVAMGKYQLGTEIPPRDVADIAAFLGTLGPER